ncbi:hypothetical protein, partial [Thermoleptolyngbya sp.]
MAKKETSFQEKRRSLSRAIAPTSRRLKVLGINRSTVKFNRETGAEQPDVRSSRRKSSELASEEPLDPTSDIQNRHKLNQ